MASFIAGLAAVILLGPSNISSAIGVGIASFAMLAFRAAHPPAGIDAFLIAGNGLSAPWLLNPVLIGYLLLVSFPHVGSMGERALFPALT
jgi:CBS-domain-containing membrane protein